jgi:hypothetical protein
LPEKLAKYPQWAERFNLEDQVVGTLNSPKIKSVFNFGYALAGMPVSALVLRSLSDLARGGDRAGVRSLGALEQNLPWGECHSVVLGRM